MMWWMWIIRVLVAAIAFFCGFWLVCYIPTIPVSMKKEYPTYNTFYGRMFSVVLRAACFLAGARVKVIGKEKLPKDGRYMLVQNHRSNFDPMITAGVLKKERISFVTKESNYKIPLGRWYMKRNGYLVMDRGDVRKDAMTIKNATEYITSGEYTVGIYPEGTRNKENTELLEFKHGCFKIALWAHCPIVVTTIKNTEHIHSNFPFKTTKVVLEIVEVIEYDDIKGLKTGDISDRVRNIMNTNLRGDK